MILGGAILLAFAGCADDEPEPDDSGKPFPGVDRNYRVFPKNPQVVEAPSGVILPGGPLARESRCCPSPSCDANAAAGPCGEVMVSSSPLGPGSCDANLIVEEYRRFLQEGCSRENDFSLRLGGAIMLEVGAGWASTRGRVTVEGASGSLTGKIEVGASRSTR